MRYRLAVVAVIVFGLLTQRESRDGWSRAQTVSKGVSGKIGQALDELSARQLFYRVCKPWLETG